MGNIKRISLIAGNWKMYKTPSESESFIMDLDNKLGIYSDREILVCPPFIDIPTISEFLINSQIKIGAQNVFYKKEGAFTGEISAYMLKEMNVSYVICGHSERRHIMGETNEMVSLKVKSVIEEGLSPILCVGETLSERENNQTLAIIEEQLTEGLKYVNIPKFVIAYEPVWAIGTGKNATDEQAQEVHSFIREKLTKIYSTKIAEIIRIIYGGSVKPENINNLMAQPDIDGALVGGASLNVDSFTKIIEFKV